MVQCIPAQEKTTMVFRVFTKVGELDLDKILWRSEIGESEQQIAFIYRLEQRLWSVRYLEAME